MYHHKQIKYIPVSQLLLPTGNEKLYDLFESGKISFRKGLKNDAQADYYVLDRGDDCITLVPFRVLELYHPEYPEQCSQYAGSISVDH